MGMDEHVGTVLRELSNDRRADSPGASRH